MRHVVMVCLLALSTAVPSISSAAEPAVATTDAIARAMPKVAPASAIFLTLQNTTQQPLTLTGANTEAARAVELHTHSMQGGMMAMRRIPHVHIAPGGQAVFAPGGLHIMLIGLQHDLKDGDTLQLTLEFAEAAPITLTVPIGTPGSSAASHSHNQH